MDGIEQKVQLTHEGGVWGRGRGWGGGAMNERTSVNILFRVMAAGSVKKECSRPPMPTRRSRGGSLVSVRLFVHHRLAFRGGDRLTAGAAGFS